MGLHIYRSKPHIMHIWTCENWDRIEPRVEWIRTQLHEECKTMDIKREICEAKIKVKLLYLDLTICEQKVYSILIKIRTSK